MNLSSGRGRPARPCEVTFFELLLALPAFHSPGMVEAELTVGTRVVVVVVVVVVEVAIAAVVVVKVMIIRDY